MHFGLQLSERETRVLKRGHRLAKDLSLFDKVQRPMDGRLGGRHGADGNLQTLPGQLFHQTNEPSVQKISAAQHTVGRQMHVIEKQFARVLRFQPQFVQRLALGKARGIGRHQEQTGSFGARRWVGFGHHNDQV